MADSYSVPPVCSLRCFIYIIYTLIVDYYESALKMKNLGLGEQNHFDESHKVRKEQRQDLSPEQPSPLTAQMPV